MHMAHCITGAEYPTFTDLLVFCVSLWCQLLMLRWNPGEAGNKSTPHSGLQDCIPDTESTVNHMHLSLSTTTGMLQSNHDTWMYHIHRLIRQKEIHGGCSIQLLTVWQGSPSTTLFQKTCMSPRSIEQTHERHGQDMLHAHIDYKEGHFSFKLFCDEWQELKQTPFKVKESFSITFDGARIVYIWFVDMYISSTYF